METGETREYRKLRERMVHDQLVPRGITDKRVIEAMLAIPRHLFVPEPYRYRAYDDCALPTAEGQTISQPFMVAVMTQLLSLTGQERVLEIGTGSGYQSALLSVLSREVYSVERMEALAASARETLKSLGYENVETTHGDGTLGLPEHAPYDRILVTAAAPELPPALATQLAEAGIAVIPVGSRFTQVLQRVTKMDGKLMVEESVPCVFVPLLGDQGWPDKSDY